MPLPAHLAVDILMSETATGNVAKCRFYYEVLSGDLPTIENIQDYANDFWTAFSTGVPQVLTTAHRFFAVHARWTSTTEDIEARSNNGNAAGTRAGGVHPEETAVVVQRRTGKPGRALRGRVFVPFVPLLFAVGSTLNNTGVEAYQTFGTMMKSQVEVEHAGSGTSATFRPVTPNFKQNAFNPIVQARVLSELASRRDRRFVKRGEPITVA